MSNVKKSEPFGYVRDGNLGGCLVFQHKISEMDALVSSTMPLYSPDQMDSYAAERVREALEQAAKKPREYALQLDKSGWGNRFPDELTAIFNAADNMADRIRALIPKQ